MFTSAISVTHFVLFIDIQTGSISICSWILHKNWWDEFYVLFFIAFPSQSWLNIIVGPKSVIFHALYQVYFICHYCKFNFRSVLCIYGSKILYKINYAADLTEVVLSPFAAAPTHRTVSDKLWRCSCFNEWHFVADGSISEELLH